MDFEKRLEKAIHRGEQAKSAKAREEAERAVSEEELKRMHTKYQLELSQYIESCLSKVPDHFPGFVYEELVGDRGWGAAVSRDDVGRGSKGKRDNFYSRLEMTVRPFARYHVLELSAKGTIRNKEVFTRKHFEKLIEADLDDFTERVDLWVIEYAELYAAKG